MKSLILSFSATGNTARLVSLVGTELEKAGHTVDRAPIAAGGRPPSDCGDYDLVIAAFPVLAMMPPVFVQRFLRRLPSGRRPGGRGDGRRPDGVRAAVIATAGGDGGPAAAIAAAILRKRGYEVVLSARANYPENWAQVGAVPGSDEDATAKTAVGDERAREIGRKLAVGKREMDRPSTGEWLLGMLLGFLFGTIGRRFLGKIFIAGEECTGCGLCARTCPARTIVVGRGRRAKPYWRMNCENCNRCINTCPKAAINTSIASIVLQFASITMFMVLGIRALNEALWPAIADAYGPAYGPFVHAVLVVAVVVAAHFVSLGPADYFIYRWLRRMPGLRRLFAITFSRGFRRYAAPGFKPEPVAARAHAQARAAERAVSR